ncbi:MAG: sulfite exporter TauE/SafE family protein [Caldimicrobium sp.]|nr:sulfite exporter TauE/SafE family protein [Caldimicrobium sp.]
MTSLLYHFPISNVETYIFIPPLFSFLLSFFCATAGISGAFLLLPFQVSILGYTAPSVTATNHLFNVIAIPSGVYRYWKEKRFYYPLTILITLGTLPGVILGYFLRISLFESLKNFKLLVGLVLLVIGVKLLLDLIFPRKQAGFSPEPIKTIKIDLLHLKFEYDKQLYTINNIALVLTALIIGVIGGIYGIGGGALMAPILLAFFRIPPYVFAGATLFGTFLTSLLGVIIFVVGGIGPDFFLGSLFGLGGFLGIYLGAIFQKKVPQKLIAFFLTFILLYISYEYIMSFFRT